MSYIEIDILWLRRLEEEILLLLRPFFPIPVGEKRSSFFSFADKKDKDRPFLTSQTFTDGGFLSLVLSFLSRSSSETDATVVAICFVSFLSSSGSGLS